MENKTQQAFESLMAKQRQHTDKYINDYLPLPIGEAVLALLESGQPLTLSAFRLSFKPPLTTLATL